MLLDSKLAGLAAVAAIFASGQVGTAQLAKSAQSSVSPQIRDLRERVQAALPEFRKALDDELADYPSARFRNVQARLVRSAYASDDGQSNKVPWTHRGGIVLVYCGEMNAKNRMGGYSGWEPFAFQPSQADIVTMYPIDFSASRKPRQPAQVNIANRYKLMLPSNLYGDYVPLLCGSEAEVLDPTDLARGISYQE